MSFIDLNGNVFDGVMIVCTFKDSSKIVIPYVATSVSTAILVDASIRENHIGAADITQHKVEVGSNISDNIRPLPKRFSMEAIVSSTPITSASSAASPTNSIPGINNGLTPLLDGWNGNGNKRPGIAESGIPSNVVNGNFTSLLFPSVFDRVADCYNQLERARANSALCAVYTSLTSYSQMGIQSISVPRDVNAGAIRLSNNALINNAIRFTIEFMEVITVSTQNVSAPAPRIKKKDRGNKPPAPATQQQVIDNRTTLQKIGGTHQAGQF